MIICLCLTSEFPYKCAKNIGFSQEIFYRVYLSAIFIHIKTEHINIQLIVSTFRIYKVHNCAIKNKNMTSYRQNVLLTQKLLKILQKSGTQLIAPPVVNIRLNLTISQNIIVKECIFLNLFTELKNIDFVKSYRVSNFSLCIILCCLRVFRPGILVVLGGKYQRICLILIYCLLDGEWLNITLVFF